MDKIKLIKSSFLSEKKTKKKLCRFIRKADILSMNKQCEMFEKNFSKKQKTKYSVFVSSGSSANLLLIQSLLNMKRLNLGDKILVSSLTWPTNIMPIIQLGLIPVLVDCNIETLNMDVQSIKDTISKEKNIKGLFLTNVLGFCSEIDEIAKICEEHNILFLEDNCESLGSEYKNKLLGNFGVASTFSFFVGHHISTIEGGMICTNDKNLYENLKMTRAHGWTRNNSRDFSEDLKNKHNIVKFYEKYTFYNLAYNMRPTEISGFLGNEQIKFWDYIVKTRQKNFNIFSKAAMRNDKIISLKLKNLNKISNFAFPLIFKNKEDCVEYAEHFLRENIEIRPIVAGDMASQPFFKKYSKHKESPVTHFIQENGFYIPNNPELTQPEINKIIKLISGN